MHRKWIVAGMATVLAASALAGSNGKAKGHSKAKHGNHATRTSVAVSVFVNSDRRLVRGWVAEYPGGGLPPGLAKRNGALPPGLEKQLRRNGRLPPGLEKKLYYFPPELEARLAPLGPGLRRAFIGGHAVIFNSTTSVVLDVFVPL
jgi:hypothetical protein